MGHPILAAAALGLAALSFAAAKVPVVPGAVVPSAMTSADLVGQVLHASDSPLARWGETRHAEDLGLEPLGRVAAVLTAADGTPATLVVAVGGLWGVGAREVEVGLDRVLTLRAEDGPRLVLDLSAG